MDFDWKSIIKSIAPILGTALGGPLAGTAVKVLGDALLGDAGAQVSQIEAAVMNGLTPEQIANVRKADQDFDSKMAELGVKIEEIEAKDRESARAREGAIKDRAPAILATIIVGGYMGVQYFLLTGTVADSMRDLVMRSLGMLDAALGMALAYYFGSSSGSKMKDRIIDKMNRVGVKA